MKLCIVTHTVNKGDGQGRVNYEVTWEALRRGHHVTLVASSIAPDLAQHPKIRWIQIAVKHYPSALLKEMVFSRQSAKWLAQHETEFDLVKVNGAITSIPGDINAVHFVHYAWLKSKAHPIRERKSLHSAYHWFYSRLNIQWETQAFHNSNIIIAVSEHVKQEVIQLGIPEERIHVILNGVDLQEFYPGEGDRHALGLPNNIKLALFAGDIRTPRKNLATVLHALVQVPNLHLVVAADTHKSIYPKLTQTLHIRHRVHFIGYQSKLADVMRSVDFFVLPSHYEPFGMVVLEAMASGLPVIVSATTGASEIVTVDCGFILQNSNDQKRLSEIFHLLVNNPDKCQVMGQVSRQIAEQYSWKQQVNHYVDFFESIAKA